VAGTYRRTQSVATTAPSSRAGRLGSVVKDQRTNTGMNRSLMNERGWEPWRSGPPGRRRASLVRALRLDPGPFSLRAKRTSDQRPEARRRVRSPEPSEGIVKNRSGALGMESMTKVSSR